ncbi:hypothetical protein MKW98_030617, partial [Papaver atlanticum]
MDLVEVTLRIIPAQSELSRSLAFPVPHFAYSANPNGTRILLKVAKNRHCYCKKTWEYR